MEPKKPLFRKLISKFFSGKSSRLALKTAVVAGLGFGVMFSVSPKVSADGIFDYQDNQGVVWEVDTSTLEYFAVKPKDKDNLPENVTVPATITRQGVNYKIVEIMDGAFEDCAGSISVTIPNGILAIKKNAFKNCTNLTSVTVPSSVCEFGESAFENCSGLTAVNPVKNQYNITVNKYAFKGSSITSFTVNGTISAPYQDGISESAFENCASLTSVNLNGEVNVIGNYAFKNSGLQSVTIANLDYTGTGAFRDCSNLTSVTISAWHGGNSGRYIGSGTFENCTSLSSVSLAEGLTVINSYAFYGCSSLESIILPQSLTAIDAMAIGGTFGNCTSLTSITIPHNVTYACESDTTFSGCTNLANIFYCNSGAYPSGIPQSINVWRYSVLEDQTDAPEGKIAVKITDHKKGTGTSLVCDSSMSSPYVIKYVEADGVTVNHDASSSNATYAWAEDNSTCTGTNTCGRCGAVSETVSSTSAEKTPASCTQKGTTTYTANFHSNAFATQTKDVEDIDLTDHSYGAASYNWSSSNSQCTGTKTCGVCNHELSETANSTSEVKTPASCTQKGTHTYTAEFENAEFTTQIKDVEDINPLGHSYGAASYTWSADNSTCTGTKTCGVCNHELSETVDSTSTVKTPASCTQKGVHTYSAQFESTEFTAQTKDVEDINPLGHAYGAASYTWSADNSSCTASKTCGVCNNIFSETAQSSKEVTVPATCTQKGTDTYTANFEGEGFEQQVKAVETPKKPHNWNITITKEVTDTVAGEMHFACPDCSEEKTEEVPPLSEGETEEISSAAQAGTQSLKCILQNPYKSLPEDVILNVNTVGNDSQRWKELYANLDDTHRIENLMFFDITLSNSSGESIPMPLARKVRILLQIPEGWDLSDIQAVLVTNNADIEFEENIVTIDGVNYVAFWTDHFSPYALIDELTDEEASQIDNDTEDEDAWSIINPKTEDSVEVQAILTITYLLCFAMTVLVFSKIKKQIG